MLAKVKADHDATMTACTPVIDCYKKLNTAEANEKVDKAEETRDKVKFALIDVTYDVVEVFPTPAANAGGASQTDELKPTAATAPAQAMAVASAAAAAAPTIRHAKSCVSVNQLKSQLHRFTGIVECSHVSNNFSMQTWEGGETYITFLNFLILSPFSKAMLCVSSVDTILLPTTTQQHMLLSKLSTGKRNLSSRIFYVNYYG
jgi:hypothetical protein